MRLLRSHGESPRYHHSLIGTTGRLDAIQAAILSQKLTRLDDWNSARRKAAELLMNALAAAAVGLPAALAEGEDHVYHQFVIRTPNRDEVREALQRNGIATGIHYPIPIHRSSAYSHLLSGEDPAPTASALAGEVLSLPLFPSIAQEQIDRVAASLLCSPEPGPVPSTVSL